jgi:hypothetical protein
MGKKEKMCEFNQRRWKSWRRMEKDGEGWRRMEKDGEGRRRMEKMGPQRYILYQHVKCGN